MIPGSPLSAPVRVGLLGSGGMGSFHGESLARLNTDLFHDAYTEELAHFVACAHAGATPDCTGEDARKALSIALAAIRSVQSAQPARLEEMEVK